MSENPRQLGSDPLRYTQYIITPYNDHASSTSLLESMAPVDNFTLNTGATIPSVGLGTWQAKPGEVQQAVAFALQNGYKHLDCALCYQVSLYLGVHD